MAQVGDVVDLKDPFGCWVVAQVMIVGDGVLSVRAQDTQGRFDEELPFASERLAAVGTHTGGGEGGAGSPVGGAARAGGGGVAGGVMRARGLLWEPMREELAAAGQRMEAIAAELDAAAEGSAAEAAAWEACLRELPELVDHCLSSSYASEAAAREVVTGPLVPAYALLARAFRRAPKGEPFPQGLLHAVMLALESSWLFENYGHGLPHAETQALLDRGPVLLAPPPHDARPSAYYVFLLNRFAGFGGLEHVCARVGRCPLKEVNGYLNLLERLFPYYAPTEVGRAVMRGVLEHGVGRVENLTNEELGQVVKGNGGQTVDDVQAECMRLLSTYHEQQKRRGGDPEEEGGRALPGIHQIREETRLRQAFRLLTCPYLNFRIKGLASMTELAEMAQRREAAQRGRGGGGWYAGGGGSRGGESNATKWLTVEELLRRVVEQKVVEVVLGEPGALKEHGLQDTHNELVRRVDALLVLLAEKEMLDAPHVDALWAAACAKQASDTQVRAVYRLIEQLAPKLRVDLLERVHGHLQRGLPRPYEPQHVELVVAVVEAGLGLPGNGDADEKNAPDPLGLMLLWEAVLGHTDEEARPVPDSDVEDDPPPTPTPTPPPRADAHALPEPALKAEVREQVLDAIVQLLIKQGSIHVLSRFLRRLLRAVRDGGRGVCPALLLLGEISRVMPEHTNPYAQGRLAKVPRASIWEYLKKRAEPAGGIHLVVIEGLRAYREQARAAARSRGLLSAGDEAEDGRRQEPEEQEPGAEEGHEEAAAQARQEERDAAVLEAVLVEGGCQGFSYRDEVVTRLEFLDYGAKNGGEDLKLEFGTHLEPLWTMFVGDPLCPGERDLFLHWLAAIIPDEAGGGSAAAAVRYGGNLAAAGAAKCPMSQAAAKDLFHLCLAVTGDGSGNGNGNGNGAVGDGTAEADAAGRAPRHPYRRAAELGAWGYQCLERYFRVINGWEGHLGQPLHPQGFLVREHARLEGMEALWDVYWRSPSAAVGRDAGAFLINLHLRLAAHGEDRPGVWAALVEHCRAIVMATAPAPAEAVQQEHQHQHHHGQRQRQRQETCAVGRALRLLRLFFEELQGAGAGEEYTPGADEVAVAVEVIRQDAAANTYSPVLKELRYYFQDRAVPLGQLRARVAADCGCRPLLVRLLSGSNQILHADTSDGLAIEQGSSYSTHAPVRRFYAVLLPRPEQDTAGVDAGATPAVSLDEAQAEERRAPLRALSANKAFLERMFALAARTPAALVPEAWALLQMAPEIAWMQEALRTLGGHLVIDGDRCATWEALLHGREPMRFLYNLQLMDKLLAPSTDPYASPEERRAALRWELAFVRMGGMAYMLAVLAAWDLEAPSGAPALAKRTLSALICRIAAFMPPRAKGQDGGLGGSGGAGRSLLGSRRRGHLPSSSSSSLFLMGMAEGVGGADGDTAPGAEDPLEAPILGHVDVDADDAENQGAMAAASPGASDGDEDESRKARRRVHRASARVFARVDRRALTGRLIDVLHEVTKSALEETAAGGAAASVLQQEDCGAASEDEQQPVAAGAIVARPVAGSTTPRGGRRNSLGGGSGSMLRGARDLLRRPSWVNQNEWGSDLFADEPARQPEPATPSEDVGLVQASLGLLVMQGAGGPGLLDVVLNSDRLTDLLRMGLVLAPDEALRRALARGVHRLCLEGRRRLQRARRRAATAGAGGEGHEGGGDDEESDEDGGAAAAAAGPGEDPVRGFLGALLRLLEPRGVVEEAPGDGCVEYFKLLTRLLKAPHALQELDPTALARTLARQIVRRPVFEATEAEEDRALQGLLTALRALLAFLPQRDGVPRRVKAAVGGGDVGLLRELFDRCLFAMPSAEAQLAAAAASPKGEQATDARGGGRPPRSPVAPVGVATRAGAAGQSLPLPKCKHATSRNLALGLVLELSAECPENLREVLAVLDKHNPLGVSPEEKERRRARALRKRRAQQQMQQAGGWRRRSGSLGGSVGPALFGSNQGGSMQLQLGLSKSRTGYVGLKNLGCICYMNSTLQQLFMVKGFRAGVLGCAPAEEPQDEEEREESLLFQLQSLFAHLQETDKAYYNPKGFCQAYKGQDGEPTDVFIQMDAHEFLSNLFTQLEALMQGTANEGLLKEYFGFTTVSELMELPAEGGVGGGGSGEKRYSARPVTEYFLQVDVPNMRDLDTALMEYIKGEVLTDYAWERKDAATGEIVKDRVPTLKRISLLTLPPHLIVHLKRFQFDFETMQQSKLNGRMEFPLELDMRPYTLEGLAPRDGETEADREARREWRRQNGLPEAVGAGAGRDHFRYRLAGVVVHMGTSNSGHYYSYIRERGGSGRGWFEFNDTIVTEFDPSDLETECFGGQETGGTKGGGGGGGYRGSWARERTRNAFLLVYDRCDVEEEEREAAAAAAAAAAATAAATADGAGTLAQQQQQQPQQRRPRVPVAILEEIMRENVEFWRKTHILTRDYFEFMDQLLEPVYYPTVEERELQADDPGHRALLEAGLRLATRFALGTLMEAKDWDGLATWARRLERGYRRSPAARAWFLDLLARDSATEAAVAGPGGLLWDLLLETEDRRGRIAAMQLVQGVANAALKPPEDEEAPDAAGAAAAAEALCLDLVRALLALRRRVRETKGGAARAECYLFLLGWLLARLPAARGLVLEELAGEDCFLDLLALVDEAMVCVRQEAGEASARAPAAAATGGEQVDGAAAEAGSEALEGYVIVGDLLSSLLRACVIPGAGGGGEGNVEEAARPEPLPPAHVLSATQEEVVCSPAFAARLVALMSKAPAKARLRALFEHLLWDNPARTQDMLEAIERGIAGEFPPASGASAGSENVAVAGQGGGARMEALKPCFRSLMLLVAVPDGLQPRRVNSAMKRVLAALEAQSVYAKATELGLAMLMRLARESPQVRAWFQQGANPRPLTPTPGAAGGEQPSSSSASSSRKAQHQPTRSTSSNALSALVHRISGGTYGTATTPTNGGGGDSGSAASWPRAGAGAGLGGVGVTQDGGGGGGNELVSRAEVRWAEEWLVMHQPVAGAGAATSAAESFWGSGKSAAASSSGSSSSGGNGGGGAGATIGGSARGTAQELLRQRLLEGVRSLARGAYDVLDYDSDMDGRAIVGRIIDIRWGKVEWYSGVVSGFDGQSGQHHIRYEDGDERAYFLLEKVFVFRRPPPPPPQE